MPALTSLQESADTRAMQSEATHPVILFDGVCNLCERSVQFVIRHDRNAVFRFASLQSAAAERVMRRHGFDGDRLGSVLLVDDHRIYQKSRAALRIARRLDGVWPIFYYLLVWVPPFIADRVYDFIGNRRYRWFGRKESCWIPDETLNRRFLDGGDLTPRCGGFLADD